MRHFTFKSISPSFVHTSQGPLGLVTPVTCGIGEFVTIGNGKRIKVVFIKSDRLPDGSDWKGLFEVCHDSELHMSIIQYNNKLGGYLYSWATYD